MRLYSTVTNKIKVTEQALHRDSSSCTRTYMPALNKYSIFMKNKNWRLDGVAYAARFYVSDDGTLWNKS